MNRILSSALVLALAAPAAGFATEATNYYPRLPGDADNQHVEYAPGATGNVVGGAVTAFRGGDNGRAVFADGPGRVEASAGVPVFIGVDDGRPVFAYVPQAVNPSVASGGQLRAPRG